MTEVMPQNAADRCRTALDRLTSGNDQCAAYAASAASNTGKLCSPTSWLLGLLDAVGSGTVGGKRQCPAHRDGDPSLSVGTGRDGRALVHCFGGCTIAEVLRSLTVPHRYLTQPPNVDPAAYARAFVTVTFPPVARAGSLAERGFRFEREHAYGSPAMAWKMRYRHPSTGEKDCRWESLNPAGERVPGLLGRREADLPLYRQADIEKAVALGEPALLCESESSVDALVGWYSTTWCGGAGSLYVDTIRAVLGGYEHLVVIPDHDTAGLRCLARLEAAGLAPHVLLGEAGEDAKDLYQRVGAAEFAALVKQALAERRPA